MTFQVFHDLYEPCHAVLLWAENVQKKKTLARFVRKVDNAIHRINHYWIVWFVLSTLIHWKANYPVDSVILPLNNWALVSNLNSLQCSIGLFRLRRA